MYKKREGGREGSKIENRDKENKSFKDVKIDYRIRKPENRRKVSSYNFDIRLKHFKNQVIPLLLFFLNKKKKIYEISASIWSAALDCRWENDICKEKSRVEANVTGEINEV